ncbi:MAG: FAD-binding and (Fe-S)-binding domain-containing protein [Candidatus Cyclobacteriaceae bacterium M3_2C_046]
MNQNQAPPNFSNEVVEKLVDELKENIRGEVRFSPGDRALFSTDSSNYRQIPLGIVMPESKQDIIDTVRICKNYDVPITSRGTGTSLAGQTTNAAVIIDYSKYYNQLISVDPKQKRAVVQPGIILDELQNSIAQHKLVFGPDPSTHASCSIGGMIGNNACGVHSVLAQFQGDGARTSDNIESMEILTYDGEVMQVGETSEKEYDHLVKAGGKKAAVYKELKLLSEKYQKLIRDNFPRIPRRVSGYNLDDLLPEKKFNIAQSLVGSEGTCIVILEATLKLVPKSNTISMVVIGFPDVYVAGDYVPKVMAHQPEACEGMDDILISLMKKKHLHTGYLDELPQGNGWLILEFGGKDKSEANKKIQKLQKELESDKQVLDIKVYDDEEKQEHIWLMRESGLGATAHVPREKDAWEGWEDSAAPPEKIGDYMRDLRKLYNKYKYSGTFYGHFGQGIVHTRIDFGLKSHDGVRKFREFLKEAAHLVTDYGGSLSGEHGDGQARGELLEIMYGADLVKAFQEFKKIWDPGNKMNPHKIVFPYLADQNLRYGANYNPPQHKTQFSYPEDKGSFSYAIERCVGVGKCRKLETGTMCPSYMATQEEKYTTRGRARLLFEMLQGKVIGKNGWKDKNVYDALNFCLACKACKTECPVNVDMATYKAEFRYHYFKGRLKPIAAYTMGLIDFWARIASRIPNLANFLTQVPPFSQLLKKIGGLAPERKMPKFATTPFKKWFFQNRKGPTLQEKPKVLLWPDTFNNYFFPESAQAAVDVLEAAGFQVKIPKVHLCCGRPLYDFGMLNRARRYLKKILKELEEDIEAGTPLVGLEPSCISVFRDEMVNLFPNNENALRLSSKSYMLSEFLEKEAPHFQFPKLDQKVKVHGHCHHKSVLGMENEKELMDRMKLDYTLLDTGCCGMAGSFGFEKENYEISVACGERRLLPEVRNSDHDTLLVANGFSCREQIEELTNRKAIHLSQLLKMSLQKGNGAPAPSNGEKSQKHNTQQAK